MEYVHTKFNLSIRAHVQHSRARLRHWTVTENHRDLNKVLGDFLTQDAEHMALGYAK